MSVAIDPLNVSNLLFRAASSDAPPVAADGSGEVEADGSGEVEADDDFPCYVHPHLAISRDVSLVRQGRGLVATAAIPAGTCLFVTPPAARADPRRVHEDFVAAEGDDGATADAVARFAERRLLEDMRCALRRRDYATARSLLVLAGAGGAVVGDEADAAAATLDAVLLRRCHEPLDDATLDAVGDDELLQIIRRNAFGPDFCTYDHLQAVWSSAAGRDAGAIGRVLPPHLLGLYPFAAMLNHGCAPNAVRVYAGERMVVHAAQDLPAGGEVVWSYLPPTLGRAQRQAILRRQHGFTCGCQRCCVEEDCSAVLENARLEAAEAWNKSLIDVHSLDRIQTDDLISACEEVENKLFGAAESPLSNEAKRYLRVGYTCLYMNYFNASLARLQTSNSNGEDANLVRNELLAKATQLHFAYCACHNASTEHLSILHLCYDLLSVIHKSTSDQSKTLPRLRFWTEQLKKAHMTRYGNLGFDLESVRKCMVHSKTVLRQKNGLLTAAQYRFI